MIMDSFLTKQLHFNKRGETMERIARVLFVEDNDISRELIRRIFKRIVLIHVDMARDGEEALKLFRAHQYDLVFMDIQLPEMDGFEVTRHIREEDKKMHRHTPVIAVTACVGKEDQQRCREAGMDDYVPKPVITLDLLEKIERYIPWTGTLKGQ